MKGAGKAACILPHGVLFRGNAEAVIRQKLVRSGYLKGIIGLPANLFYGTGIPACILVLDKENASARKGLFMIDASKGFIKDGNKNRLREQDIHRIVDTFAKLADVSRYARMVPFDEIADPKNDFNLNLPRYIDSTAPEDRQDIDGHLRGGIPESDLDALDAYWHILPTLRRFLFESAGRAGYARLTLPLTEVKPAILGHVEFTAFQHRATEQFANWRASTIPRLTHFDKDDPPKALIETIAEDLLESFRQVPLLDGYDIYQHLMDYWAETMQDDAYLITADGWLAQPTRIIQTDKRGRRKDKGWACDLIPKPFIVARYFASEQAAIEAKQADLETANASLTELSEEHSGEEGYLGALDKINKATIKARLKALKGDTEAHDEIGVLKQWLTLAEQETALKREIKQLEQALDSLAYQHYPKLSLAEIKQLVIEDRWLTHLTTALQSELDRVSQTITGRIRELAERYASPLPQLTAEVESLTARVEEHLKQMGATWT